MHSPNSILAQVDHLGTPDRSVGAARRTCNEAGAVARMPLVRVGVAPEAFGELMRGAYGVTAARMAESLASDGELASTDSEHNLDAIEADDVHRMAEQPTLVNLVNLVQWVYLVYLVLILKRVNRVFLDCPEDMDNPEELARKERRVTTVQMDLRALLVCLAYRTRAKRVY